MLPAHYVIDGMCAACRSAIKAGVDRYRVGDRDYHADCFDISLVGGLEQPPTPPAHRPPALPGASGNTVSTTI